MREITRDELDQAVEGQTIVSRFLDTVRPTPTRWHCARSSPTAPSSSGPTRTTPTTWPGWPPTSRGSVWVPATASS